MFEKVSQIAEQAATNVSRRRFFGRFGRGAMAVAVGVAGLLVGPRDASAGRNPGRGGAGGGCWNGHYICPDGSSFRVRLRSKCRREHFGCELVSCTKC